MKRILILIHVLFCGYICPLLAEDTGAVRYQDSILKVADTLPATLVRLTYLRDMAYKHQYAPYNMTFSTRLYEEARRQKNAFYENMGAYYLAACYDKKHDPDSLSYWVDVLKDFVPQVGTYDYYLEQKAAISRALASKRQIEKAVYVAKETLEESKLRHSNNGMIAAYNSLGCAYGVSSRPNEALDSFLEAYRNFSPQTKASLKVDILSRIAQVYGNGGKDSLKLPYLHEMDTTLQTVISKEPETRKNWSNFEIDCEVKYILHYMNRKNFTVAHEHIEKVKKLLEPHVDPVFWLNVQLIQLQYYAKTDEYDKSIALIDEVTPTVLNNYVSTFATLINYKASTQYDKGDIDGAIETRRYLIRKQDSLNNAFSANQLKQVKEIYHIDELLLEKQKIQDMNYRIGFILLGVCLLLMLLFYLYTRYVSGKIAVVEKKTAEAALQAETDNIAKERLKSEISHDIHTPKGYAEADPTADVAGLDAARKAAILSSIAFNTRVSLEDVKVEGITNITPEDITYAKELGYIIKLLAIAKHTEDGIDVRVHPTFIDKDHPLASVRNVFNAIFIHGNAVGDTMFYGKGAGERPTASAVLADIIDVARDMGKDRFGKIRCTCYEEKKLCPPDKVLSGYYIRLLVEDKPGVLGAIATAFGESNVSLYSVIQKRRVGEFSEIVAITHNVNNNQIEDLKVRLNNLDVVHEISNIIRVVMSQEA